MRQRDIEGSGDVVRCSVPYEIYLKGREDPVRSIGTFEIDKGVLRAGEELESLMEIVANHLFATIDVVREHRFVLSDERFNKVVVLTDHIQAVSILAPDENTFIKELEG